GYFLLEIKSLFVGKRLSNSSYKRGPSAKNKGSLEISKNRALAIFILGISCFILYGMISPDSKELIEVRRRLGEGNHLLFGLSIISSALMVSAFFLCIKAHWRLYASTCILLILSGYLLSSPGRNILLLTL